MKSTFRNIVDWSALPVCPCCSIYGVIEPQSDIIGYLYLIIIPANNLQNPSSLQKKALTNMVNTTAGNSSHPYLCAELSCILTKGERNVIIVSLFAVAFVSLSGNIPILIVTLFSSKRRNSSNLATINLVISDILMTVFCVPFVTMDLYMFGAWVFGPAMCFLVTFVQNTAIQSALLNLLAITCEKFLAVRFPFHVRLRKRMVCRFMPVAWILAIAESIFHLSYRKHTNYENGFHCADDFPDFQAFQKKLIVKTVTFFCPLAVIIVLHSITVCSLLKGTNRTFQLRGSERDTFKNIPRKQRKQRKATKIILVTLISIVVCWGPFYVFNALHLFDFFHQLSLQSNYIGYAICAWLLYSHCFVFPLIYCFFTQKGRETVAICFLCLRTCRMPGYGSNTTSLLIDTSNNNNGSFRGFGRQSSLRRCSASAVGESRL